MACAAGTRQRASVRNSSPSSASSATASDESLEPDYNVALTKPVYAVMTRGSRGERRLRPAGRGAGAAGGPLGPGAVVGEGRSQIGSRMINARAETVDSKPAFRQAFTRRAVPAAR